MSKRKLFYKGDPFTNEEFKKLLVTWQFLKKNKPKYKLALPPIGLLTKLKRDSWLGYTIYRPNFLSMTVVPYGETSCLVKFVSVKLQVSSRAILGRNLVEAIKLAFVDLCYALEEKIKKESRLELEKEKISF